MHINVEILFAKLEHFIDERYLGADRALLIGSCRVVLFNDVTNNCVIKGTRGDWIGLPAGKSLFGSPPGCGLPIGNLTSQVFANSYLNTFDHFVKHDLGMRYYGRYVDDLVFIHTNREYLRRLIPRWLGAVLAQRAMVAKHVTGWWTYAHVTGNVDKIVLRKQQFR